ncbi:MAG: hypothetical protein J6A59_07375 [Lachnospiraceae bacterium]|nr:hypothetical protein [Lachnospiraceae bacterium]
MVIKEYGFDLKDLFILMIKLIRENKVADIALLNTKCMKSLSTFNNVNEMLDYANSTYCDSIIIKKNGAKAYTEQIYLHKFNGFKLNQKSVLIYLKTMKPNGKWETQSIRF